MAGSINKVILVGNLGRDPESRETSNGKTLCRFSLATSDRWTDREGQQQERTVWHNVKCWAGLANLCQQHLRKGSKVYVEGRLESREDEQGRKFWDVVAQDVVFLDPKRQRPESPASQTTRGSARDEGSWGTPQPKPEAPGAWGDWRQN